MPINKGEITKEQIAKAMQCKSAEELIAFAKSEGIDITKEEAEAYLAEMNDVELDDERLQHVAGGNCWGREYNWEQFFGGLIMPIDKSAISKEMLAKAMQCETADELIALAKSNGYAITKTEAEAYLSELDDVELDEASLQEVAGGRCYNDCPSERYHCRSK